MKTKSHLLLGKYVTNGLGYDKRTQKWAFIFGCIEPDYNYLTYLRGSLSKRLLAGHSFESAEKFMRRVISKLEAKVRLSFRDYYRLGKLTHYIVDSFTYAHNANFPGSLPDHRSYELALKEKFVDYLSERTPDAVTTQKPLFDALNEAHAEYMRLPASPQKDMNFVEKLALMVYSEFAVQPA